ncbi:MAG: hypothetical protein ACPGXL_06555 [Chitinophagales bacterium]
MYQKITTFLLFFSFVSFAFQACNFNKTKNDKAQKTSKIAEPAPHPHQHLISEWVNEGSLMKLVLTKNNTCILSYDDLEKEDTIQSEVICKGTWEVLNDSLHLSFLCSETPRFSIPTTFAYEKTKTQTQLIHDEDFFFYNAFPNNNAPDRSQDDLLQVKNIVDFVALLPERYLTFSNTSVETQNTKIHSNPKQQLNVKDVANNYAAIDENKLTTKTDKKAVAKNNVHQDIGFETKVFAYADSSYLLVASNRLKQASGTFYDNYFLQYKQEKWQEVSQKVLPTLPLSRFIEDETVAQQMTQEAQLGTDYTYHFKLPQKGNNIEAGLAINTPSPSSPMSEDDIEAVFMNYKSLKLTWNKTKGQFELEKVLQ